MTLSSRFFEPWFAQQQDSKWPISTPLYKEVVQTQYEK